MSGVDDGDLLLRLSRRRAVALDLLNDIHTFNDFSKDDVLACNEEVSKVRTMQLKRRSGGTYHPTRGRGRS